MNISILGYLATVIVLISFILRGEIKIRIVNLIGAIVFVIYGIMLPDLPVVLLNGCLIAVHIWQFWRMRKESKTAKALAEAETRVAEAEAKLKQNVPSDTTSNTTE